MAQAESDLEQHVDPPTSPKPKRKLHPALAANTNDTTAILSKAHHHTQLRTNIRRNLKEGHLSLPTLLSHLDDPIVNRMKVRMVLMSMPGLHQKRVAKVMTRIGIGENKRLGGLNERQISELNDLFAIDHSITLEQATSDTQRKPNASFYPPGTDGRARTQTPWETRFRSEEWNDNPIASRNNRLARNAKPDRDWRIKFMRELISHQPFAPRRAAEKAGVSWKVAKQEMADNDEMAEVIEEARQAMREKVLEAAWEMGVEGEREPIVWNGEIIAYKKVRNAAMTQFVAKALDPELYDSKVRAARITASALTDPHSARQRMMNEFKDRFADFDSERQKILSGRVIDAELDDDDSDDEDDV